MALWKPTPPPGRSDKWTVYQALVMVGTLHRPQRWPYCVLDARGPWAVFDSEVHDWEGSVFAKLGLALPTAEGLHKVKMDVRVDELGVGYRHLWMIRMPDAEAQRFAMTGRVWATLPTPPEGWEWTNDGFGSNAWTLRHPEGIAPSDAVVAWYADTEEQGLCRHPDALPERWLADVDLMLSKLGMTPKEPTDEQ